MGEDEGEVESGGEAAGDAVAGSGRGAEMGEGERSIYGIEAGGMGTGSYSSVRRAWYDATAGLETLGWAQCITRAALQDVSEVIFSFSLLPFPAFQSLTGRKKEHTAQLFT